MRKCLIYVLFCLVVAYITLTIVSVTCSTEAKNGNFVYLDGNKVLPSSLDIAYENMIDTLLTTLRYVENDSLLTSSCYTFGNYFNRNSCTYVDTVKNIIIEINGGNFIIWVDKE